MSETLTNGVIVPDKGSRDWYADLRSNWLKLDSLMAGGNITVSPAQTEGVLVATITVGGKEYKLYQQDGDVSVKIDPSTENAEYPLVASTSAEANTGSVVMAPAVTVNPSTGAVTATSFKGKLDGNASTATNATKAVQDGSGAVITDTYATKKELGSKADDANVVHKSGDETIAGNKTYVNGYQIFTGYRFYVKNSNQELGAIPKGANIWNGMGFYDKNNKSTFAIENGHITDGTTKLSFKVTKNADGVVNEPGIFLEASYGTTTDADKPIVRVHDLNPFNNNAYTLGTSTLKWKAVYANSVVVNDKNVLTDANQIMVLKNLTGNKITSGAVIDCGTGNGLLVGWFMNTAGVWVLANNKPTGKWKSSNNHSLLAEESGMFVKVG